MKKIIYISLVSAFLFSGALFAKCHYLIDFEATKLRSSETINFCELFEDKVLLVVNTASQCGFTPQFSGLEDLHQRYKDKLAVVGFPSDDFNQEHADSEKIGEVCYINYGVTFTMLEPSSVKGPQANLLFKNLAQKTGQAPGWNFNKYLISADGTKTYHFPSKVAPNDAELNAKINELIGVD
ncbi:MAG: glutathione peroxidase [Acidiferrobacterales bacterium]|nr:glutathione peroxidase [Acidiferrobacterales bacterium]